MKCAPFEYVLAGSVDEVVKTLVDAEGEGKILAGGQSLVPVLALRLARPSVLIDVNRIPGLAELTPDGDAVHVGALTRHVVLARQHAHPLLAEAARWIGHAAIRSRGTTGGSMAHADPAAELPVVAVALGAVATVVGPAGVRLVSAEDLLVGPLMSSLGDDEMITNVRFPVPSRWGFAELARRHGDFALVTVVVAEVAGVVRIAIGGVGPVPVRGSAGERVLARGGSAGAAAGALAAELTPTADLHGSTAYRKAIAAEMLRRACAQAGVG